MSDKPIPRMIGINSEASKEHILEAAHWLSGQLSTTEAELAAITQRNFVIELLRVLYPEKVAEAEAIEADARSAIANAGVKP